MKLVPQALTKFLKSTDNLSKAYNNESGDVIQLTYEEKLQLYTPWKQFVIIKAVGRKFNHQYLKTKTSDL